MYKIGEYIVYKMNVCKIKDIKVNNFTKKKCYVLVPVNDESLTINVPIDEDKLIRNLLTKKEIDELIKKIPTIEVLDLDDKNIEIKYRELLRSDNPEDLVKIIKTTYLRNKKREENKRSKGQKDEEYFELAEKYFYTELSVVLNLSCEDTKNYVINEVLKHK